MSQTTKCDKCGQDIHIGEYPFCPHGFGSNSVVDDTIVGGMTLENVGPTPVTFYSKAEHKRYLSEHGLVSKVRHVGTQGSDKSPHTSRWI